jgi:aspartyl-tRNA(Asn)/glutamyl-tRNA(Gln) amidotransferase subunit C
MLLSRAEIEHVALLSRLKLTDEEVERFTVQLNDILEHFTALQGADTSGVSDTTHAVPMVNVFREDVEKVAFTPDEALQNAPDRSGDLFKVPRVVD